MKVGRNAPCHCGSGKKTKHCHGRKSAPRLGEFPGVSLSTTAPAERRPAGRVLRQCGECTACCTELNVNQPGMVTLAGEPCPHLGNQGCTIYHGPRPQMCKSFVCNYLIEPGNLTIEERPDRAGAILRRTKEADKKPPLDELVYVNECVPGGLAKVLDNRAWGPIILRTLLAGTPILFSRTGDPHSREVIHVRFFEGALGCELTSCRADGAPVLKAAEPLHDKPLPLALVIPNQDYAFDAVALMRHLGDRESTVVSASQANVIRHDLHFLFTRRQAELLEALLSWTREGQTASRCVEASA